MNANDLAQTYAEMSDDELLDLAADYDSLTEIAKQALRAEFHSRKLEPPELESARSENEEEFSGGSTPRVALVDPSATDSLLRTYFDLKEAVANCDFLIAGGIAAYVEPVSLPSQNAYAVAPTAYQLCLPAEQLVDGGNLLAGKEQQEMPAPEDSEYDGPRCPKCHSADIGMEAEEPLSALEMAEVDSPSAAGAGVEPKAGAMAAATQWQCMSCGFRWRDLDGSSAGSGPER